MSKTVRTLLLATGLAGCFLTPSLQAKTLASAPVAAFFFQSETDRSPATQPSAATSATPTAQSTTVATTPRKEEKEADEGEENAQFKYSKLVLATAHKTGLSKETIYWIYTTINFLILAAALWWITKKFLPHGFAPRTAEIQKGIAEARKASAEANARLSEIEAKLAKLDGEVAQIQAAAETDFSAEEQRIKEAAEKDAAAVIASAEQEIAAASRAAQRDLQAYAAGLAVRVAEKKIQVDERTDATLIDGFAKQLGKDQQ